MGWIGERILSLRRCCSFAFKVYVHDINSIRFSRNITQQTDNYLAGLLIKTRDTDSWTMLLLRQKTLIYFSFSFHQCDSRIIPFKSLGFYTLELAIRLGRVFGQWLYVLSQQDFPKINTSKAKHHILIWVGKKCVWHNTIEISRLLTTDLHLHGWELALRSYTKEAVTVCHSQLVFHLWFLLHIYYRTWIHTSETLERINTLCSDSSFMFWSPT